MKTFVLNDEEVKTADEFKDEHSECAKKYVGVSGGHFSYRFVPDSLGIHAFIECYVCKKQKNITDYSNF